MPEGYANPWNAGLWPGSVTGTTFNMTLQDVIDWGYDLGLSDYPIWDEAKREWLNSRIVDHFRLREIRGETPAMFVWFLNRAMNENMPQINLIFEALEDITPEGLRQTANITGTTQTDGTETSKATATSKGVSYDSTNPRQTMVGKDATEYYDAGTFSQTGSESESSGTSGTKGTTTTAGYSSSDLVDVLNRWATGMTNPLQLVFAACEPCFSQLKRTRMNNTLW